MSSPQNAPSQGVSSVVVGLQFGDEGKGAVVDRIAPRGAAVVRFNGGSNAGHTIILPDGSTLATHALPSGIAHPGMINMLGPNCLADLGEVIKECKVAETYGATVVLDRSAPFALPIHKVIDAGRESRSGGSAIGTTKRGIGPGFEDLASRRAPKLGDLTSAPRIRAALTERGFYEERAAVARHLGYDPSSLEETVEWCMQRSADIVPLLGDTRRIVRELLAAGDGVLFEGAQAVGLDVLQGSQPYTTSSVCTAAGVSMSYGIYDMRVIGVAKAYVTRVGAGPFPTKLDDDVGAWLRVQGHEFGSTTGRPRDCGWLDLVQLRANCHFGGVREIALTKLDVLSGMDEIKVCIGYEFDGRRITRYETLTGRVMREATPVYAVVPGWQEDISGCRRFEDLPLNAQKYVLMVSSSLGIPVVGVGVGPGRQQYVETV
ncbi:MAG: adenylosuccinate synthetase [Candidatus Parcubacteria bacterium]|jgi:adenylosuccinate synthase